MFVFAADLKTIVFHASIRPCFFLGSILCVVCDLIVATDTKLHAGLPLTLNLVIGECYI